MFKVTDNKNGFGLKLQGDIDIDPSLCKKMELMKNNHDKSLPPYMMKCELMRGWVDEESAQYLIKHGAKVI